MCGFCGLCGVCLFFCVFGVMFFFLFFFFFSSRRRHTRLVSDWSSDVCSSDLPARAHGFAHQMHRMLGVTYKSAWFMMHRLREAMRTGGLEPMGGAGKVVEADEAYHGNSETPCVSPQRRGRPFTKKGKGANKRAIIALVERGGRVRSFH